MKTSLKDWRKVHERIKNVRGLDEREKILFARSLAATPDERWQMNENCLKLLGLAGPVRSRRMLERRKAKLRRLEVASFWRLRLSNEELEQGQMLGMNWSTRCKS